MKSYDKLNLSEIHEIFKAYSEFYSPNFDMFDHLSGQIFNHFDEI
jgi:hypothetical protein